MNSVQPVWRCPGVWLMFGALSLVACNGASSDIVPGEGPKNDLSKMRTADITIQSAETRHSFKVWIADSNDERNVGLMNTTEEELPTDRGMLFVFPFDQYLSFWMRNTIIPLDIAFVRSDGTIVKIHTMAPLDESGYPSFEPARYALEVRADVFGRLGIREGDRIEIPASVLNSQAP